MTAVKEARGKLHLILACGCRTWQVSHLTSKAQRKPQDRFAVCLRSAARPRQRGIREGSPEPADNELRFADCIQSLASQLSKRSDALWADVKRPDLRRIGAPPRCSILELSKILEVLSSALSLSPTLPYLTNSPKLGSGQRGMPPLLIPSIHPSIHRRLHRRLHALDMTYHGSLLPWPSDSGSEDGPSYALDVPDRANYRAQLDYLANSIFVDQSGSSGLENTRTPKPLPLGRRRWTDSGETAMGNAHCSGLTSEELGLTDSREVSGGEHREGGQPWAKAPMKLSAIRSGFLALASAAGEPGGIRAVFSPV